MKKTVLLFQFFLTGSLFAVPIETGLTIYSGTVDGGTFNTGVDLYQAKYYSAVPEVRSNSGAFPDRARFYETYLRFMNILDDGHSLGVGIGMLDLPGFRVRDYSSALNGSDTPLAD